MSAEPHIVTDDRGGVRVMGLVGDFDINVLELLGSTFDEAIGAGKAKVAIDLSATTFLDSMALGSLISARSLATENGGWVRLVAPSPYVRKVLRVTSLDAVFGVYDSVEEASSASISEG
ncbi:MAG TPA: STAS domain-containing protein [Marmoricola sp.]|nr:STAS domain-containing protein [Marmoricola sp.]